MNEWNSIITIYSYYLIAMTILTIVTLVVKSTRYWLIAKIFISILCFLSFLWGLYDPSGIFIITSPIVVGFIAFIINEDFDAINSKEIKYLYITIGFTNCFYAFYAVSFLIYFASTYYK